MMKVSLSFFLFIQLSTLLCQEEVKEVGVNTPVTLSCPCSKNATVLWTIDYYSNKHKIAERTKETCSVNKSFQKRYEIIQDSTGGNFDLHIPQAAFNDAGSYRCTCDGKDTDVHLHVIYFVEVTVTEGSDVTLPCYRDTRKNFKNMMWKKNNQIILSYTAENKREEAKDSRNTLKKGGGEVGDLSLYISLVNKLDAGLYRCLFNDETDDGEPRGVHLKIEDAKTQPPETQPPETQPPETLPSETCYNTILGSLLGLACFVIICLTCYIIYKEIHRRPQPLRSQSDNTPVQEEFPLRPKPSSTRPIN